MLPLLPPRVYALVRCYPLYFTSVEFQSAALLSRVQYRHASLRKQFFSRRIDIQNRQTAWIESIPFLTNRLSLGADALGGLFVVFQQEKASDAGGVRRDWFSELSSQIIASGLVQTSGIVATLRRRGAEPHFVALGAFLGLAILQQNPINLAFSRSFYRALLGQSDPWTHDEVSLDSASSALDDIKTDFPDNYRQLTLILETDLDTVDGKALVNGHSCYGDLTPLELQILDQPPRISLGPGTKRKRESADASRAVVRAGSRSDRDRPIPIEIDDDNGRPVSNQNKYKFIIDSVSELLWPDTTLEAMQHVRNGFNMFIDYSDTVITPDVLKGISYGQGGRIDITQLERHTVYPDASPASSVVVGYFWSVVKDTSVFSDERVVKLLRFISGSDRIPIGGFGALSPAFSIRVLPAAFAGHLPMTSTCNNALLLPPSRSVEDMQRKLLQAIGECATLEEV
jgi:hypothetical protein